MGKSTTDDGEDDDDDCGGFGVFVYWCSHLHQCWLLGNATPTNIWVNRMIV
jgi:hypothetical protein